MEHGEPTNVCISNNEFVEMLPEDPKNDQYGVVASLATDVLISRNILDNPVLIRQSKNVEFSENTKVEQTQIDFESKDVLILRNTFEFQQPTTASDSLKNSGIFIRELSGAFPDDITIANNCLLYTSPSPRDGLLSRMPSSA